MYDLHDLIRSRVVAQSLHRPKKANYSRDRQEILSRSWWLYSDHDIQSRFSNQIRFPKKRLLQGGALSLNIYGVNRLISQSTFQFLLSGFRKDIKIDEIIQFVINEGSTTILQISKALDLQPIEIEKSIKKGLKTWNIIKYQDKLYHWKEFLQERNLLSNVHSDVSQVNGEIVLMILDRYPILTINQIALLSGYNKGVVENQIYEIVRNTEISRGIMRKNSNEEYFNINQENQIFDINWAETPDFVLEKRDALIEVLKLERNFEFSESNYWFFINGIPQAQFNLSRDAKSNQYIVKGFNRLLKTKFDLSEIEYRLKEWGKTQHISLSIDFTDSPYAALTKKMIFSLGDRGYKFKNGGLSLQLDRKQSSGYNSFSLQKLGNWYLDRHLFGSVLTPAELLHELIQLDDLNSLHVRLPSDISSMNLNNIIYTSGINYRLGFIHRDMLPIIIKAWPRAGQLRNLDHRILELLENNVLSTAQILSNIDQPKSKILARIRYLEQIRKIHRDLSQGFSTDFQKWKIFGIETNLTNVKSLSDIGKIIQQILSINPPLTISQLSRYLGLSFSELTLIKQELIKSNQIIEGYFFDLHEEIQLSVPHVVNTIQELMDSYDNLPENQEFEIPTVQIVPQSDPIAILHLSDLILKNKSLEIKSRIDPTSKIWLILWHSFPAGYLVQIPSKKSLIDYDIEINIVPELAEISVLSLIIDKLSYLNQLWESDELYLTKINDTPIRKRKFEQLQFILDSVGIKY